MITKAISKLYQFKHLSGLVLLACLWVTGFQAYSEKQKIDQAAIEQFHDEANHVAIKIEERLRDYALILRGGAGFFASSNHVAHDEWKTYVRLLNAGNSVKGIQTLSFIEAIPAQQLAAHVASMRADGFPHYTVSPSGARDMYAPLTYLEPLNKHNQSIIGVDMFTNPAKRAAMERARDTGQTILSAVTSLKEDEGGQAHLAVIIYEPVYYQGMPLATLAQRRAAIMGWVNGAYYVNNVLTDILQAWPKFNNSTADLHVYDGPTATADNLMFDKQSQHRHEVNSAYYYEHLLHFNDRSWLLTFDESAPQVSYYTAWVVLVSGLVLSSLLFLLMNAITNIQRHAQKIAKRLNEQAVQREQLLKESESRWRFAIEEAGDGLWDWNIADNTLFVSARWKAMLGYKDDEIAQGISMDGIDQWETRIHPDDKAHTLAALHACLDQKTNIYTSEYRLQCKDGSYKWILDRGVVVSHDDKGKPTRMIGVDNDITERKQREMNAIEYNAQLSAIFDLSPDGFVTFNATHQVSYVNPAFEYMTGLINAHVMGLNEVEFSHQLIKQCTEQMRFVGVRALSKQASFTVGHLNEHAQTIEIDSVPKRMLKVSLVASKAENVSQILYLRDITEETEVNQLKTGFIATAAHELRTPMTSILGYAELLTLHDFDPVQRQDFLQTICRQSKMMTAILDDLLDLSHIESNGDHDFVMSRIELGALLQEVIASFSVTNDKCPTELTLAQTPLWVNGDLTKIARVLNNLLSNAYKYSPHGGAVDITLMAPVKRAKPKLDTPAHHIGIRIADHGLGMTPMQLAHVYDRFYRADVSGKIPGTGLGMSIVKEIVTLHGGQINITSEIGKGTVVTLWLPVATELASDPS